MGTKRNAVGWDDLWRDFDEDWNGNGDWGMNITYRRIKHAAHYAYNDPRGGHDLEQWDCPDVGRMTRTGYPMRPEGVPTDAEYHSGYVTANREQRWLFVRRAEMSAGTCAWCEAPKGAVAR